MTTFDHMSDDPILLAEQFQVKMMSIDFNRGGDITWSLKEHPFIGDKISIILTSEEDRSWNYKGEGIIAEHHIINGHIKLPLYGIGDSGHYIVTESYQSTQGKQTYNQNHEYIVDISGTALALPPQPQSSWLSRLLLPSVGAFAATTIWLSQHII